MTPATSTYAPRHTSSRQNDCTLCKRQIVCSKSSMPFGRLSGHVFWHDDVPVGVAVGVDVGVDADVELGVGCGGISQSIVHSPGPAV